MNILQNVKIPYITKIQDFCLICHTVLYNTSHCYLHEYNSESFYFT